MLTAPKTLYLLRHGQTEYNRLGMVQGSGVDSDLNETGRQQSLAFFHHYKHLPFELVYASALKRTAQTIAPFLQPHIEFIRTPNLNEISWGDNEGKTADPEQVANFRRVVHAWSNGDYEAAINNGESAAALEVRLRQFIQDLNQRPEQLILVCSHGRTLRALVTILQGKPLSDMGHVHHENTGLFVMHQKGQLFEVEVANSVRHLSNEM